MHKLYDPRDHYWIVGGDENRLWSSARAVYVAAEDAVLAGAVAAGLSPTRIASEAELWDVLASHAPDKVPAAAAAQDALRQRKLDAMDAAQVKVLFNHENRIRALEGKPALTHAQFKAAIFALI